MIIYFLILIFCLLLSGLKISKGIENVALAIVTVFICFGYTTGTDWVLYEQFYYDNIFARHLEESRESGYYLFQTFFSAIGINFWVFHISVKIIVFLLLIRFVRLFEVNIFLFLVLFLPDAGFFLFIDCPFRNLIAIGISLIAIEKLIDKKNISFFLLILLAMMFHTSAFIMFFIFILFNARISSRTWVILTLISFIIAFRIDFLLNYVFIPLSNIIPPLQNRLLYYFLNDVFIGGGFNLGSIIRLLAFGLLIIQRKKIQQLLNGNEFILNMAFLFIILYPWGISMKIFQRFSLYLMPVYTISILFLLKSLNQDWKKYFIYAFFILFGFLQTRNIITFDHRYVPYTNYLFFQNKDKYKSVEDRKQYNLKLSPYTKDEDKKQNYQQNSNK